MEGDKLFLRRYSRGAHFYPRPPGGGRPHHISYRVSNAFNFYPRPPGGGRLRFVCNVDFFSTISIHALRVEGDTPSLVSIKIFKGFLSTPSGWRATFVHIKFLRSFYSISIHALRVEGDGRQMDDLILLISISIHALRVEGDYAYGLRKVKNMEFLSTPSGWRATVDTLCPPIEETDFYPRPPGGGRLVPDTVLYNAMIFLSTPSGWRATLVPQSFLGQQLDFYPRPPGGGRPFALSLLTKRRDNFYPRPPGGGRPAVPT